MREEIGELTPDDGMKCNCSLPSNVLQCRCILMVQSESSCSSDNDDNQMHYVETYMLRSHKLNRLTEECKAIGNNIGIAKLKTPIKTEDSLRLIIFFIDVKC